MMSTDEVGPSDQAQQSRFSDPGRFGQLLRELPVNPSELSAVARNVIVHYRGSADVLPADTREDINLRWVREQLMTDQRRHGDPLSVHRELSSRVQGCCRDHTLLCVSTLRAHGIPARSRVGFAGYFTEGWHHDHDHVIVEAWLDGRWHRFDPELVDPTRAVPDPVDMDWCAADGPGFTSASSAWLAYRRDEVAAETFGVDPDVPVLRGPWFLFNEVIIEIAHRFGDELLLWDLWGRMAEPATPVEEEQARWIDEVAGLLAAADQGDRLAEGEALSRYRSDPGLHPGTAITQGSPWHDGRVQVTI